MVMCMGAVSREFLEGSTVERETTPLSRNPYTRGIKCLPHPSVLHNLESGRFEQLRDALFHLAAPKCRGHLAQDFIYRIERRRVLPDHYQRQVAAIAQDPAELAQRAHNIVRRKQFQQVAA